MLLRDDGAVRKGLERLARKGQVFSPSRSFYVVVPPEFRRLADGQLTGLRATELSLYESGIFGCELADLNVDRMHGNYVAALSSRITGHIGVLDFTRSGCRDVDLTVTAELAKFGEADLSSRGNVDLNDLRLLAELAPWPQDRAGTRITDCAFAASSFHDAVLEGTNFVRSDFGRADFARAFLSGASFISCKVDAGRLLSCDAADGRGHSASRRPAWVRVARLVDLLKQLHELRFTEIGRSGTTSTGLARRAIDPVSDAHHHVAS